MSTYKGKYYKVELVRANNEYECAISGQIIERGDHYLNIRLENGIQRPCANGRDMYTPTDTIRVHRSILAEYSINDILDLTGAFRTKEEQLLLENRKLHVENNELRVHNRRLQSELTKYQVKALQAVQGTELHDR